MYKLLVRNWLHVFLVFTIRGSSLDRNKNVKENTHCDRFELFVKKVALFFLKATNLPIL